MRCGVSVESCPAASRAQPVEETAFSHHPAGEPGYTQAGSPTQYTERLAEYVLSSDALLSTAPVRVKNAPTKASAAAEARWVLTERRRRLVQIGKTSGALALPAEGTGAESLVLAAPALERCWRTCTAKANPYRAMAAMPRARFAPPDLGRLV